MNDEKVNFMQGKGKRTNELTHSSRKIKERIFLFSILLFPIVQFLVFYVALNFNSILMAFQAYDENTSKYYLIGFSNFKEVLTDIFVTKSLVPAISHSLIQFSFSLLVLTPLNIVCSYVIFKKVPFSGFLKVMLFMPNLISVMVFVICARTLITYGFPTIFNMSNINLLDPVKDSSFWTVLIFGLWMSFAGGLVVYLSAMGSVSKEVLEYGRLEPLSTWKELIYVIVPSIFPTIVTYIVVAITGFFINAGHFFSFFGGNANRFTPFDTLGYYFFVQVAGDEVTGANYTYAAAGGILFTLIVAPVTLITKHLLEKYGPSED